MVLNYVKVVIRTMLQHKGYEAINIIGLTVSIAACFFISLWVIDELSYDRFHIKAERTYRASWNARYGDNEWNIPLIPAPVGETLEKEFPEVEKATRFRQGGISVRLGNEFVRKEKGLFVEESFFDVFTVKFISGSPSEALKDPDAVILTTEMARVFFPDQDALGKTIQRNDGTWMRVSGVVSGFPAQSHFHFDFLAPLASLPIFQNRKTQWGSATVYTYVVVKPGSDVDVLQQKLQQYVDKNIVGNPQGASGNFVRFPLTPLLDIHVRSHQRYELEPNGNITYLYLFSLIAVFILVLACINFINLATARSLKRAREVAVRKMFGSTRLQLVRQFLAESFMQVLISVAGAVALSELLLPVFNDMAGKQLVISFFDSPIVPGLLAGIIFFVTMLAGAYPATLLSSFSLVEALKGGVSSQVGTERLRKVLVTVQFCMSIGLIASTAIVYEQLQYVQNTRLGFDREHVLVIKRTSALGNGNTAFRGRLKEMSGVAGVSTAQFLPGQIFDSMGFQLEQPANYQQTSLTYDFVDEHFVDVLKLTVQSGRNFFSSLASDSSAFLINESAARAIGWKEPLGKNISIGRSYTGPVIGVLADFNFESLHHEVKPLLLLYNRGWPSNIAVRLRPGRIDEALAAIRDLWKETLPNSPFEYSFLDMDYQSLYQNEGRVAEIFSTSSLLAIVIACLGLFGLASYTAEQRTKEIGIRKVLGASVSAVIGLLSKDFLKLVLVANAFAWPVAYVAMSWWLEDFAYRTEISWWVFVFAGGLTLLIALGTVSFQAVKAALANPIEALRYE